MHIFLLLLFLGALGAGLFCACLAVTYVWLAMIGLFVGAWVDNSMEEAVAKEFPIGKEAIFTGRYFSDSENPRFNWHKDGKDWTSQCLRCQLIIPYEGGWTWLTDVSGPEPGRGDATAFDLEFRGKISEKGSFGDNGGCRYKIEVLEILSVHPYSREKRLLLRCSDGLEAPSEALLRPAKESSQTDPQMLLRPAGAKAAVEIDGNL